METESFPRGGKRIVNDNIPVKRKHDDNVSNFTRSIFWFLRVMYCSYLRRKNNRK
jgi:hypothetical protein